MKQIMATIVAFLTSFFVGTAEKVETIVRERPFDKYTIESLAETEIKPGRLEIDGDLFTLEFNPNLDGKTFKKTTGEVHLPKGEGPFPVVVMFRGYIDQEEYKTGDGTRRASEVLARNGLMTLAPDFLGYGGSDPETENIFEARFQTYITALALLESLEQVPQWNGRDIFLWGHSNGGQIALTTLEITGEAYPAALWAPVSKPFPYSVLYYTDESEDRGKLIRRELARFEADYDVDLFSIHAYYDRIKAPLQLHQGTADDAVPQAWSDTLEKSLKEAGVAVDYYIYRGADHNMRPSWNSVVQRDIIFFAEHVTSENLQQN